jgi:hypothetical protein
MRVLLFLSRVALLCNLLFLVCVIIQHTKDFIGNSDVNNYVIILGWFVAPFFNITVNVWWLIALINKRAIRMKGWLVTANLLFLLFQFFVLFVVKK